MTEATDESPRLELYKWYEGPYQIPKRDEVVQGPKRGSWCNAATLWPGAWRCVAIEQLKGGARVGRLAWCEVLTGSPHPTTARAERMVRQARAGTAIRPTPAPTDVDIRYIALRPPSLNRIVEAATMMVRQLCISAWGGPRECTSLSPNNARDGSQFDTDAARVEVYRLVEAIRLSGELVRRGEPPVWEIEHAACVSLDLLQKINGEGNEIRPELRDNVQACFEALNQMTETALRADDQVRYWTCLAEIWTLCRHLGLDVSGAKLDKHYNG